MVGHTKHTINNQISIQSLIQKVNYLTENDNVLVCLTDGRMRVYIAMAVMCSTAELRNFSQICQHRLSQCINNAIAVFISVTWTICLVFT